MTLESTAVFDEYARYYDLLYRDKDYQGEADYVAARIRQFAPRAASMLELGSGTGIHARLLAEKGFRLHGVERSPVMLERARAATPPSSPGAPAPAYTCGDIRNVRVGDTFDAVVSLFHVISYQTENSDLRAAFDTARTHLQPGGLFLFDVWYGPAVLTTRPEVRIKRMSGDGSEVTRLAEPVLIPNRNLVDVRYHVFVKDMTTGAVRELREAHLMRYLFHPEIKALAEASGFGIVHAEEWMSGREPGFDTWGVCFILRAI